MTRDEIIAMAKEACGPDMLCWRDGTEMTWEELERFFHLAYAAGQRDEREACAKVLEQHDFEEAYWCADRIRARGEL